MNAVLFAFTAQGKALALRVRDILSAGGDGVELRAPERLEDAEFAAYSGSLPDSVGGAFDRDALVFVGACGIAVRAVAPHVSDKRSDPAVLCLDEQGQFVIPLLSGHIGGANRLARRIAEGIGATPVVTTASDINGRFSVDAWAAEQSLHISDMALAKRISAEILSRDIPFYTDAPKPPAALPDGLVWADVGPLGVCVSIRDLSPFDGTLLLVPRALRVGLGCRRGTSSDKIEATVRRVFAERRLRLEAVAEAASIDVKAGEPGLVEFCQRMGWPVAFHTAQALAAVPGAFAASDFVRNAVGVDNVCERAAAASGGRLIVPKTAMDGVTVAVAEMNWGLDFGQDPRGGHRPGQL